MRRRDLVPYLKNGCTGLFVACLLYVFNSLLITAFVYVIIGNGSNASFLHNMSLGNETLGFTSHNVHRLFLLATLMTFVEGTMVLGVLAVVTLIGRRRAGEDAPVPQNKGYAFVSSTPKAHEEFDLDEDSDNY